MSIDSNFKWYNYVARRLINGLTDFVTALCNSGAQLKFREHKDCPQSGFCRPAVLEGVKSLSLVVF